VGAILIRNYLMMGVDSVRELGGGVRLLLKVGAGEGVGREGASGDLAGVDDGVLEREQHICHVVAACWFRLFHSRQLSAKHHVTAAPRVIISSGTMQWTLTRTYKFSYFLHCSGFTLKN